VLAYSNVSRCAREVCSLSFDSPECLRKSPSQSTALDRVKAFPQFVASYSAVGRTSANTLLVASTDNVFDVGSRPAYFHCPTLDLQLKGDDLCG